MGPWVSNSRPGAQLALAVGASVVGASLAFGFRGFRADGENALAGFLLGLLLLVIGVSGILASGRQTVTVDPKSRRVTVDDRYLFGSRSRVIAFQDIGDISIGYLGKASNYVQHYYLVLHLANGTEYSLFAPGRFFEGSSSRSTVEGWRERLQDCINSTRLVREARSDVLGRG